MRMIWGGYWRTAERIAERDDGLLRSWWRTVKKENFLDHLDFLKDSGRNTEHRVLHCQSAAGCELLRAAAGE